MPDLNTVLPIVVVSALFALALLFCVCVRWNPLRLPMPAMPRTRAVIRRMGSFLPTYTLRDDNPPPDYTPSQNISGGVVMAEPGSEMDTQHNDGRPRSPPPAYDHVVGESSTGSGHEEMTIVQIMAVDAHNEQRAHSGTEASTDGLLANRMV